MIYDSTLNVCPLSYGALCGRLILILPPLMRRGLFYFSSWPFSWLGWALCYFIGGIWCCCSFMVMMTIICLGFFNILNLCMFYAQIHMWVILGCYQEDTKKFQGPFVALSIFLVN